MYSELHEFFRLADVNGDGSLTTQEFRNILEVHLLDLIFHV